MRLLLLLMALVLCGCPSAGPIHKELKEGCRCNLHLTPGLSKGLWSVDGHCRGSCGGFFDGEYETANPK